MPFTLGTGDGPRQPAVPHLCQGDIPYPAPGSPAGNAFSTAPDMVRFARALAGGRLLSPAWAGLMTSGKVPLSPQQARNQWPPSQLAAAGCCPNIRIVNDQAIFGHTGGAAGETTAIDIYPRPSWVTVILSNYGITNEAGSLIELLDQLIS